jgi:hypothetical protein
MLEFLLFLFVGVGITNIVVNASILDYPRDFIIERSSFFGKLVTCMLCSGFWVGMILWIFNPYIFLTYGILAPISAGATISLSSSFYDIITDYLLFSDEVVDETKD